MQVRIFECITTADVLKYSNPVISHWNGEDAQEFEGKARRRGVNRFEHPVTAEQRSFSLEEPAESPFQCEITGLIDSEFFEEPGFHNMGENRVDGYECRDPIPEGNRQRHQPQVTGKG